MEISVVKQKDMEIFAKGDTVTIKGEINHENPEIFLTPFFNKVLIQMDGNIVIDLRYLEYLNSSGIKPIIGFLMSRNPDWHVKIKSDPKSTWQRTSLKVLASLDDNIALE